MKTTTTRRLPIISAGFDGNYVLCDEATKARIGTGTTRNGFRGNYRIDGGRAPHKPGSTGKVWTDKGEFFPGVVNAVWLRIPN